MGERTVWPTATAGLFVDAAGIAAYIDGEPDSPDAAAAEKRYREELAELRADPSPTARRVLAATVNVQHGAVTAWLDALVHLGAARWETIMPWGHRQLVIRGPEESDHVDVAT